MTRIAINGLGRIGRLVLRQYIETHPENLEIVAANDLVSTDDLAYLIKYDTATERRLFRFRQRRKACSLETAKSRLRP